MSRLLRYQKYAKRISIESSTIRLTSRRLSARIMTMFMSDSMQKEESTLTPMQGMSMSKTALGAAVGSLVCTLQAT